MPQPDQQSLDQTPRQTDEQLERSRLLSERAPGSAGLKVPGFSLIERLGAHRLLLYGLAVGVIGCGLMLLANGFAATFAAAITGVIESPVHAADRVRSEAACCVG